MDIEGSVGDTQVYISSFFDMPSDFGGIETYMQGVKKDKGFFCFSAVIKCLIGNKPEIYFIILALIQATLLILVYRKYSPNFFLLSFYLLHRQIIYPGCSTELDNLWQ